MALNGVGEETLYHLSVSYSHTACQFLWIAVFAASSDLAKNQTRLTAFLLFACGSSSFAAFSGLTYRLALVLGFRCSYVGP